MTRENVFERQIKAKTYHYIQSYYPITLLTYNFRFKILMVEKKRKKERTYSLDGFTSGELISGIISLLENRRAYIRGGLITGGGFNVRFYGSRVIITVTLEYLQFRFISRNEITWTEEF